MLFIGIHIVYQCLCFLLVNNILFLCYVYDSGVLFIACVYVASCYCFHYSVVIVYCLFACVFSFVLLISVVLLNYVVMPCVCCVVASCFRVVAGIVWGLFLCSCCDSCFLLAGYELAVASACRMVMFMYVLLYLGWLWHPPTACVVLRVAMLARFDYSPARLCKVAKPNGGLLDRPYSDPAHRQDVMQVTARMIIVSSPRPQAWFGYFLLL